MNENINLCKLLKGHEGETFYTPLAGDVKLETAEQTIGDSPIRFFSAPLSSTLSFTKDGKYHAKGIGECLIFPSKNQRDWNKWADEQKIKTKTPKTWSEFAKAELFTSALSCIDAFHKSNRAYLKICTLIEICYGGVPTKEERMNKNNCVYVPIYNNNNDSFDIIEAFEYFNPIAFRTDLDCSEFLSYPENVQLLKDFYML